MSICMPQMIYVYFDASWSNLHLFWRTENANLFSTGRLLFILVLSTAVAGLPFQATSQSNSWPRASSLPDIDNEVASHFLGFVQGYAASRGYRISEISQRELYDSLSDEAFRLSVNRDEQFEAEAALMLLVDTMIELSGQQPGFRGDPSSFTVLGESSFFPALSRLCPIWPICN